VSRGRSGMKRRVHRGTGAPPAGLAAFLAVGLAACGGDPAGIDPASERGRTLNDPFVIAVPQVGEIYDPTRVLPAEVSAVTYNVFDWLFDRNHRGEARPGLAESWTLSPDATELTLELRRGVTFHDGAPLTADDVVFSWARMLEGCCSTRVSRQLETIEALDAHTVRIRFAGPEIAFTAVGGFPVVSEAYYEEVGEQRFKEQPVGSGPYRFVRLVRGQYVELERYDAYWGPQPEVARVVMRFVTEDTTRVAQLRTGEADMAMMVPYPLVPQVQADPALKTEILTPGGMTAFLALKTDNPRTPWADRRVREAIALAIDQHAIVEGMLLGYPEHYPLLAPGDLGYDPALEPYPYDPQRARELLEAAGAVGLELEIPYIAGTGTGVKETAEAVALYLNEVGIRAVARAMEGPQFIGWVQKASRNPEMDYVAVFIGGIAGRSEPSSPLAAQFSAVTPFAWYVNPKVNSRVLDIAATPEAAARAEKIRALGRVVHEDMRYIPLWTSAHVYGMKRCIEFMPTLGEYDLMLLRDVRVAGCIAAQR